MEEGLTIIGPICLTSAITCTSQEEYDNLSEHDRNQVEQIFPGHWKGSPNPRHETDQRVVILGSVQITPRTK
jgi:hypothetical protein